MVDHRNPPKPPFYENIIPGQCRWCGETVNKADGSPSRATWHPICVVDYQMVYWPGITRKAVWMRDEGKCAVCGHRCSRRGSDVWHLDHIQPLIEAKGDIRFWQMGNLQTLCQVCHKAKTSREATERAGVRKQIRELGEPLDPQLFSLMVKEDHEIQKTLRDKIHARNERLPKKPPPKGARRRR